MFQIDFGNFSVCCTTAREAVELASELFDYFKMDTATGDTLELRAAVDKLQRQAEDYNLIIDRLSRALAAGGATVPAAAPPRDYTNLPDPPYVPAPRIIIGRGGGDKRGPRTGKWQEASELGIAYLRTHGTARTIELTEASGLPRGSATQFCERYFHKRPDGLWDLREEDANATPEPAAPAEDPDATPTLDDQLRTAIHDLVAENEGLVVDAIAEELAIPAAEVARVVDHPWFYYHNGCVRAA